MRLVKSSLSNASFPVTNLICKVEGDLLLLSCIGDVNMFQFRTSTSVAGCLRFVHLWIIPSTASSLECWERTLESLLKNLRDHHLSSKIP